jgi:hypothetical protein
MNTPAPASSGRVPCPRCGANNFATQAACWKCGTPLTSGAAMNAAPAAMTHDRVAAPALTRAVDPVLAHVSAFLLAFFFPALAVPVGLVFFMLDERRKVEVGRTALVWGVIFTVLHVVVTGWLLRQALGQLPDLLSRSLPGRAAPTPDTPVPPLPRFPDQ